MQNDRTILPRRMSFRQPCRVILWASLLLLWSLTSCRPAPELATNVTPNVERTDENGDLLHAAIWSRLALMPSVAYAKFIDNRPVTDRSREEEQIERFRRAAELRGIAPDFAEAVMRGQIEASKQVQEQLSKEWKAHPPTADWTFRSLNNDLRPAIDETNDRMLVALQMLGTMPDEFPRLMEQLSERRQPLPPNVTEEAWATAWWPLRTAKLPYLVPRPGRVMRGPTMMPTLPERQPLLPDFMPEPEDVTPNRP